MSRDYAIPPLNYDALRAKACEFFDLYYPSQKFPIPIEQIIEKDLRMDIIPMPGLRSVLDGEGDGVDAYTSSDLKELTVDEHVYKNYPSRYVFTLAHEVGHVFLHRHLYEPRQFSSIETWKSFLRDMPTGAHQTYEWQANSFAGLILVPEVYLEQVVDKHLRAIVRILKSKGQLIGTDMIGPVWDVIYDRTAKDFGVSSAVIQHRIGYDNLNDPAKLREKIDALVADPLI